MEGLRHADRIIKMLEWFDPKLDGGLLTDAIPGEYLVTLKGRRWSWQMNFCDLLLVEEATPMQFVMAPGRN
jgi:hypothetical protein